MTSVDWTRLEPHRPLDLMSVGRYVARPEGGAGRLAQLVQAGAKAIAVVGPTGIGKSTELMMAASLLIARGQHFASPFLLDHLRAQAPALDALQAYREFFSAMMAMNLAQQAGDQQIQLSAGLLEKLKRLSESPDLESSGDTGDLLLEVLREVRRASGQKPVTLLCDGLEKYDGEEAGEVLEELLRLRDEAALVIVVPTALVVGPQSYEVISNFKLFPVHPVPIRDEDGTSASVGRGFLKAIVYRRLNLAPSAVPELDPVLERAAEASGGVPRAFLQLVLDASMYARLAEREWPTLEDLGEAMGDHAESLRRLLIKGDVDALRAADGTDGLEVDPERRLRFLTHGLLLEYKIDDRIVVHPAPLLAGVLARSGRA